MLAESLERLAGIQRFDFARRHEGKQNSTHGAGMRRQPTADADVAGEWRVRRAAHEVEHVGAVEHAEMGGELRRFRQSGQHWHRDLHKLLRE